MRKFQLCFLFKDAEFDMVIDFKGTWVEVQGLGLHLARQFGVQFLTANEIEEDDLK